jgi:serine/threonine protein kinase
MQRLGRYQLTAEMGAGPCGTVTRGKVYGVVGFEREFVIKQFFPALVASPQAALKVSSAARIYGQLEHPRIGRMSEFLVAKGKTFAAIEFVPGLDMGQLIADAVSIGVGLPHGGVFAVLSQIARAIGYAHGRGVFHLGLSPRNLILMPEGDCKVVDFGFLNACMPARPVAEKRLEQRIGYLAPEQLVGEPTSAATDVFALAAIAYELIQLRPAFSGETAMDTQQAVLGSQPPDPSIPRPLIKVLQRALARSPFERFPDARAFADALDAALRVAPMPGARKDMGDRVKSALTRISEVHAQELSGVVPLPTVPYQRISDPGLATQEYVRPEPIAPPLSAAASATVARATLTDMEMSIAVASQAQAVTAAPTSPVVPATATLLGISSPMLAIKPVTRSAPTVPPVPMIPKAILASTPVPSADSSHSPLGGAILEAEFGSTAEFRDMATYAKDMETFSDMFEQERLSDPEINISMRAATIPATSRRTGKTEPPFSKLPESIPAIAEKLDLSANFQLPSSKKSSLRFLPLALVATAAAAGGVWFFGVRDTSEKTSQLVAVAPLSPSTNPAQAKLDAAVITPIVDAKVTVADVVSDAHAMAVVDAEPIVAIAVLPDAPSASPPPDADTAPMPAQPGTVTNDLLLESTPSGGRVFVDGADQGVTPLKLPGSTDRHSIAITLPNHDLYLAEIDGKGKFKIALKESMPLTGPAGVKVRCKDKARYYVFIDGKPTGQLCPTEKIGVSVGDHVLEVYDITTESRRQFPISVKSVDRSLRVRVD